VNFRLNGAQHKPFEMKKIMAHGAISENQLPGKNTIRARAWGGHG
jgi:hypothetical protein